MNDIVARNARFLHSIFERGPFEGHAFVVTPSWPAAEGGDFTLSDRPVTEWVPWVVEQYRRKVASLEAIGDDAVPYAKIGTGTHIYAAAFGSPVHRYEGSAPAAMPFVDSAEEADRIVEPDIWKSPTLYRVFELAAVAEKELGKDVPLGPPDMQTGFDTACLIWNKESLYCAMMDRGEKDSVHRLAGKCARLLKSFLTELRREFPQMSPLHCPAVWCPQEMGPWVSNDECGAMGVRTFEEFCLPELIDLAETFGGLGMHCCADAEHQFPSFRKIPNFYGFNRVQARRGYEPILEHFGGPEAPVHVIGWVDDALPARLMELAPPGTRFVFNQFSDDTEWAKAWLEKMRRLSPRTSA